MYLSDPYKNKLSDQSIEPLINGLLFIISTIAFIFLYPHFVWGHYVLIFRISHLIGNAILLYIIIKHHNYDLFNIGLVLFFLLISIYAMVAGTEYHNFTYIPFMTLFFIALRPNEQFRIFNHFVSILAIIYFVGLVSYLLSILGMNIKLGIARAPNPYQNPFIVYFGHAQETGLSVYRFSSVFDEAGLVGTINGLVLSAIGISTRNIKSLILLLAGLVSFSMAFYAILIINLLFNLNIRKSIYIFLILIVFIFAARNKVSHLIRARMSISNGHFVGDNRTHKEFDTYYRLFISKGGKELFFGKGVGYAYNIKEAFSVSSFKLIIVNYGIIGTTLMLCFYAFCVYLNLNSKEGWFIFFIFVISAYQRPDMLYFYNIVIFFGGLRNLKYI